MRYGLSLVLLSVSCPLALAQDNETEKLFRDMEKKINEAGAFRVVFEVELRDVEGKGKGEKYKGVWLLTKDNRARLNFSQAAGGRGTYELVSNGKHINVDSTSDERKRGWPTPKGLQRLLSTTMVRGGGWFSHLLMGHLFKDKREIDENEIDPEKMKVHVYNFRAGAAEKVAGRDAKLIIYKFGDGSKDDCPDNEEISLWIDAKTLLPLKRVFVLRRDGVRTTEMYPEFTLEPKLEAKVFELPK